MQFTMSEMLLISAALDNLYLSIGESVGSSNDGLSGYLSGFAANRGMTDDDLEALILAIRSKFLLMRQNNTMTFEVSIVGGANAQADNGDSGKR